MNDRLPGTTFGNPIRYRGYRVYLGDVAYTPWVFSHEDYDGPGDNRCGYGKTEAECKEWIDEIEDDAALASGMEAATAGETNEDSARPEGREPGPRSGDAQGVTDDQ